MTETDKKTQENVSEAHSLPWFVRGLRDGIPICMGYFAVAFALGITARGIGMNALGFLDIRPACSAFMPIPRAVMPRAKATAK